MLIHALIGAAVAFIFVPPHYESGLTRYLVFGSMAALAPDSEHILYWYVYGRKSQYSQVVKKLLRALSLKKAFKFFRDNHKELHSLYLHNGLTPIVLAVLAYVFYHHDKLMWTIVFASSASHYFYDIIEDYLLFKKVNLNWILKFDPISKPLWPSDNQDSAHEKQDDKLNISL